MKEDNKKAVVFFILILGLCVLSYFEVVILRRLRVVFDPFALPLILILMNLILGCLAKLFLSKRWKH